MAAWRAAVVRAIGVSGIRATAAQRTRQQGALR
jgi:hypothetical protein